MSKQPNRGSQKRRPQQRKGRTAMAAKSGSANRTTWLVVGVVLAVGIALTAVFAASNKASAVGPQPGKDHWHAALGVYYCDQWLGDGSGEGVWQWPAATAAGSPARVGTSQYAGLHSHADGIIHMEPVAPDESGEDATVGNYFDFGGWDLSESGFSFLGTTAENGDKCGDEPGTLRWATAKFDGNPDAKQSYTEGQGNPADFKLNESDIVVIAFLPESKSLDSLGNPPSLANLLGAEGREGQEAMPTVPGTTAPAGPSTTAPANTATTEPNNPATTNPGTGSPATTGP
jgi:hypothetical protein